MTKQGRPKITLSTTETAEHSRDQIAKRGLQQRKHANWDMATTTRHNVRERRWKSRGGGRRTDSSFGDAWMDSYGVALFIPCDADSWGGVRGPAVTNAPPSSDCDTAGI